MRNPNKKRGYPFKRILKRRMRRIAFIVIAAAIAGGVNYYNKHYKQPSSGDTVVLDKSSQQQNNQEQVVEKIRAAAKKPGSQFWVSLQGKVIKLLKDDLDGSRHQKFLIRVAPDITLLVSHNIDLAKRVPVRKGDQVQLRGRYEWNNRGGVVHWTHHDPRGKKQGGWIRVNGKEYR